MSCHQRSVPKFFLLAAYLEVKEFVVLGNCLDCGRKGHSAGSERADQAKAEHKR